MDSFTPVQKHAIPTWYIESAISLPNGLWVFLLPLLTSLDIVLSGYTDGYFKDIHHNSHDLTPESNTDQYLSSIIDSFLQLIEVTNTLVPRLRHLYPSKQPSAQFRASLNNLHRFKAIYGLSSYRLLRY